MVIFEEIDSTKNVVRDWFFGKNSKHFKPFETALAFKQTAGTGRNGHSWETPANSAILATILVPIDKKMSDYANLLGFVAGLSGLELCRTVINDEKTAESGKFCLKWPNDILFQSTESRELYKIAGVMTEYLGVDSGKIWCSVSLGLNVFQTEGDFDFEAKIKPSSLVLIDEDLKNKHNSEILKKDFIITLTERYANLVKNNLVKYFENADGVVTLREDVAINTLFDVKTSVRLPNGDIVDGVAKGIDDEFALILADNNQKEHKISVGDITVAPLH